MKVSVSFFCERTQRLHAVHVAAERSVILELQGEFNRRNQSRGGHISERIFGHARDVDHQRNAAAGPDVNGRSAAGETREGTRDRVRQFHGIFCDTSTQRASRSTHEEYGAKRGLAVFLDSLHRPSQEVWNLSLNRT